MAAAVDAAMAAAPEAKLPAALAAAAKGVSAHPLESGATRAFKDAET
jgi:hypothetical protein